MYCFCDFGVAALEGEQEIVFLKDRAGKLMKRCHACRKIIEIKMPVGRREECPFCGADLHCCLNCNFYSPGAYNDCKEPLAERVIEKNRSNFCDLFVFRDSASALGKKDQDGIESAMEKLRSLFNDR